MTDHLPHLLGGDCTGEWRQYGRRGEGFWHCEVCGEIHPSTPETDKAADLEYARGLQLRSQTRQGRFPSPKKKGGLYIELPEED